MYYAPADETEVITGIVEAAKVYGEDNRTGIELYFVLQKSLPSPCPPAPPRGHYAICYSSAGGSTITQLVGAALGLQALTPGERSEDAFIANALQPALGMGDKLTLGQVFHIHAALGTPGFPDCTLTSAPCPSHDADVKP